MPSTKRTRPSTSSAMPHNNSCHNMAGLFHQEQPATTVSSSTFTPPTPPKNVSAGTTEYHEALQKLAASMKRTELTRRQVIGSSGNQVENYQAKCVRSSLYSTIETQLEYSSSPSTKQLHSSNSNLVGSGSGNVSPAAAREKNTPTKQNRTNKTFEQRIEDLRAYKEKHGHVKIRQREDKSLYNFCKHARQARSNPEKSNMVLNDDRIASLDALGFDWSAIERAAKISFAQRVEDLRAYKEKHGHVKVKKREDKSLHNFCRHMRQARNKPEKYNRTLTVDGIASLDALGFNWSVTEQAKIFAKRIDDLRAYKEKHGHINVKKSEKKTLHNFCNHMRQARKHPEKSTMIINEERIASLDTLGFEWNTNSDTRSFE